MKGCEFAVRDVSDKAMAMVVAVAAVGAAPGDAPAMSVVMLS